MNIKAGLWRDTLYHKTSGVTDTIKTDAARPRERWYAQRVSVRDRTTAGAVAEVYVERSGVTFHLVRLALTNANQWYDDRLECWLHEGENIRVEWSSVLANDELDVHVVGNKNYPGDN